MDLRVPHYFCLIFQKAKWEIREVRRPVLGHTADQPWGPKQQLQEAPGSLLPDVSASQLERGDPLCPPPFPSACCLSRGRGGAALERLAACQRNPAWLGSGGLSPLVFPVCKGFWGTAGSPAVFPPPLCHPQPSKGNTERGQVTSLGGGPGRAAPQEMLIGMEVRV